MTRKQASRRLQTLSRQIELIGNELSNIRHDHPEWEADPEPILGALMVAVEKTIRCRGDLRTAARYLADTRTTEQRQAANEEARRQERLDQQRRVYGCTE